MARQWGSAVTFIKTLSLTQKSMIPLIVMAAFLIATLTFGAWQITVVSSAFEAAAAQGQAAAPRLATLERPSGRLVAAEDPGRRAAQARQLADLARGKVWSTLAIGVLAAFAGLSFAAALSVSLVTGPMLELGAAMGDLARGRTNTPIDGRDRDDELGQMARAMADLRERHLAGLRAEAAVAGERAVAASAARLAQAEIARIGRALSVGEFTPSIAHEINQPISAIAMNCDACLHWLSDEGEPSLDKARAAIERIGRDAHRAAAVVNRVRAMLTNQRPEFAAADLNALAAETLSFAESELRRRDITAQTAFAADLPPVRGDAVQLQQVMLNLISNAADAMKATPRGERVLTLTTGLSPMGEPMVTVQDRGPGLGAEAGERLFEAFFTTKPGGIGLGLPISRSIVEQHGGRLWAGPADPGGAAFSFTVQAVKDNVVRPPGFAAAAIRPAPAVAGRRRAG